MKIKLIFFICLTLSLIHADFASAQPVPPNAQVQPKTIDIKTAPKVIPDLPYKPQEIEVPSDVKGDDEEGNDSDEPKALDWTKIPPLSPKGPNFKPAPDPEYD